jgi:glucosamine 6-phosphate synthetase-like amidotransferase/phosphosugar isomerase protein
MCGIAGYIGQSKRPKLTFELITSLFDYLELRGTDASGVWGTEVGENGRVIYHKEPIRSSDFINQNFWFKLKKIKTDMLLVHARATSRGGGNANCNINNHPFVSQDKRIGMVHNGTIEEADYLKEKYELVSETDSECLLRIFEHGMDCEKNIFEEIPLEISSRLNGIKEIWSYISTGAMAVALGERFKDDKRGLFLFRNEKRPLWVADLRELLGQVFFFSSPDIWYRAIASSTNLRKQCWGSQKIIEVPSHQVWYFSIDQRDVIDFYKFKLDTKIIDTESLDIDFKAIKPSKFELEIISDLKENDEIKLNNIEKATSCGPVASINHDEKLWSKENDDFVDFPQWSESSNRDDHEKLCKKISQLAMDINTATENMSMEGSLNDFDYSELIESLEQTKCDLEGTLQILKK